MKKSVIIAVATVVAAILIGSLVIATHASAATTISSHTHARANSSCTAQVEKDELPFAQDRYRVAISCTQIDGTSKVRGVLALRLNDDARTVWFTDTGKTYYSPWKTSGVGDPEARAEFADR